MRNLREYSRWFGRFTYRFFEVFFLIVATWALLSQLLPHLRVNSGFTSQKDGVEIFIRSNGVHTDFVLPVRNKLHHWDSIFHPEDFHADSNYHFVAIGWGDKGFFLNTPTWGDLTFSTAFVAATGLGESAMHVDYVATVPKSSARIRQFTISEEQYRSLITYITSSFRYDQQKVMMIDHVGYGQHDKFFEANGRYSLFKTCNEWTGDGMEEAGLPVGIWTPLEDGIMNK